MRSILVPLFILLSSVISYAQRNEYSVNAGAGLFHFSNSTNYNTQIIYYTLDGKNILAPYSSKNTLGYTMSVQLQRITKAKFIYGLSAGYEQFHSNVIVDGSQVILPPASSMPAIKQPVTGDAKTTFAYINLHPFAGYRIQAGKLDIDIAAGTDLAFATKTHQVINVTLNTASTVHTNDLEKPALDIRPGLHTSISYKHFAINAGYSFGITKYPSSYDLNGEQRSVRLFRFGIGYRI